MQHLEDYPVLPDPDTVQGFRAGDPVGIRWDWICRKILNMFKNAGNKFLWNFPEIFLNTVFEEKRIRPHPASSQHTLFEFGKTHRTFIPPFCDHGEIMEIFFEMLVFCDRENNCHLVSLLIDYVLFSRTHGDS